MQEVKFVCKQQGGLCCWGRGFLYISWGMLSGRAVRMKVGTQDLLDPHFSFHVLRTHIHAELPPCAQCKAPFSWPTTTVTLLSGAALCACRSDPTMRQSHQSFRVRWLMQEGSGLILLLAWTLFLAFFSFPLTPTPCCVPPASRPSTAQHRCPSICAHPSPSSMKQGGDNCWDRQRHAEEWGHSWQEEVPMPFQMCLEEPSQPVSLEPQILPAI